MTGKAVLEALVRATDRPEPDRRIEPAASAFRIALELGDKDAGRSVAAALRRLTEARLVSSGPAARRLKSGKLKTYASQRVYSPTTRGREVDAILAQITPARGGSFVPRAHAGITLQEGLALR